MRFKLYDCFYGRDRAAGYVPLPTGNIVEIDEEDIGDINAVIAAIENQTSAVYKTRRGLYVEVARNGPIDIVLYIMGRDKKGSYVEEELRRENVFEASVRED